MAPLIAVLVLTAGSWPSRQRTLLADTAVWMIGWEAIYLPVGVDDHVVPVPLHAGSGRAAGLLGGHAWTVMRAHPRRWTRRAAGISVATSAALWLMGLVNTVTDARMQLAFDDTNRAVIEFLAALPGRATIWVSVPTDEFLSEIGVHLSGMGRGDLRARPLDLGRWGSGPGPAARAPHDVIAVPELRGQTLLSVRVPIEAGASGRRNARLRDLMGDDPVTIYAVRREVHLLVFRLRQPVRGALIALGSPGFYCRPWEPFVGTGVFSFGCTVYRTG